MLTENELDRVEVGFDKLINLAKNLAKFQEDFNETVAVAQKLSIDSRKFLVSGKRYKGDLVIVDENKHANIHQRLDNLVNGLRKHNIKLKDL